jgi:hypothetical protein
VKLSGRKKADDVSCELPKKGGKGGGGRVRQRFDTFSTSNTKEGPSNNSHNGCGRDQTENGSASDNENG